MCLIGIGRIGRTKIVKVIFHYVKYMYHASCFIGSIKDGVDSFKISCKILEKFKEKYEL